MRIVDVKGFPVPRGKQAITIGTWIFTKSKDAILTSADVLGTWSVWEKFNIGSWCKSYDSRGMVNREG